MTRVKETLTLYRKGVTVSVAINNSPMQKWQLDEAVKLLQETIHLNYAKTFRCMCPQCTGEDTDPPGSRCH